MEAGISYLLANGKIPDFSIVSVDFVPYFDRLAHTYRYLSYKIIIQSQIKLQDSCIVSTSIVLEQTHIKCYLIIIILIIMKINLIYIISIFLILTVASSYDGWLRSQKDTVYPYLVEYIDQFTLGSNDVQKLLANQFKQITIGNILTSSFQIYANSISLSYKGGSKVVQKISPLKVRVTNDSFQVVDQFSIKVIHTLQKSKNYSCQVRIPQIFISYVKEVDFSSGNTLVTEFKSSFLSTSFGSPNCKQTIDAKDKPVINDAANATKDGSIFLQLKKTFDKTQEYLSLNAKDERLSKVYDSNPYSYDYYGFKIDVNVSTIRANGFKQNGIENEILGSISDTSTVAIEPPEYQSGYTTFVSLQFMKNLIQYTKNNYGSWQAIRLTRSNMRTKFFKFRLIDFEQIIPNLLRQYPNNYLSDVEILCTAQSLGGTTLSEKYLIQEMDWRCLGSFEDNNKKKVVFLNFLVGIKHSAQLMVQQNYMGVRVDQVQLTSLNFDYVDNFEVVDPFTLSSYINQGLFEFRVQTIGTFFKVSSPNRIKKQVADRGIWVG